MNHGKRIASIIVLLVFISVPAIIKAEGPESKKPIKETIQAKRVQQVDKETDKQETESKEKNTVGILEVKKNILEVLKGQDVLTVQKVMKAIDTAAEKGEALAEKIVSKGKRYAGNLKESTEKITSYTKKQFELIKNRDELEELEEALDEMKSIYSDKLDAARDELISALDKFEEIYSGKIDSATEGADELLEKIEDKEGVLNEHFRDIIDEMNELAYAMQDELSDKVMELTEEMEMELDSALEKYEEEIDKLVEKKEQELDKKEESENK